MYNQKGGLKLINPEISHIVALTNMLNSPGVEISILSVMSLKGFILIFSVQEENSEYFMQNISNGRFDTPVTSYILKLAVTTPSPIRLDPYAFSNKLSETPESFYNEVLLQQNVWIKSITGNRPPICPSIGSFFLFNNINAVKCLNFFKSLTRNELKSYRNGTADGNRITTLGKPMPLEYMARNKIDLFDYLLRQINSYTGQRARAGLGMILMQNVLECQTLETFLSKNITSGPHYSYSVVGNARAQFNNSMSLLISQIIRLFIEIGVIHFDLHENNALYGGINIKKWLLIDFGLASDVVIKIPDFYLDVHEKDVIQEQQKKYNVDFESLISRRNKRSISEDSNTSSNNKIEFISDIMEYIINIDREKIKEKYSVIPAQKYVAEVAAELAANPGDPILQQALASEEAILAAAQAASAHKYQMMWYDKLKMLLDFDDILENAFVQLYENTRVNIESGINLSGSTLNSYQSQGFIFGLKGEAKDYLTDFPSIQCGSDSICTISGGKIIKNKTKKQRKRKNKKNKNYNKTIK